MHMPVAANAPAGDFAPPKSPTETPGNEVGASSGRSWQQERPELAPTSFPGVSVGDFGGAKSPAGAFAATGLSIGSGNGHINDATIQGGDRHRDCGCGPGGRKLNGPAHITGVERSVIVVSCRQFRMHNCSNVDVYLLAVGMDISTMQRSREVIDTGTVDVDPEAGSII
jgi:hypothetical protein